jgi:hypothetical protein
VHHDRIRAPGQVARIVPSIEPDCHRQHTPAYLGCEKRLNAAAGEGGSEPGKGTTVRLTFPLAPAHQDSLPQPLAQEAQPLRILLVDDNPMLLKSLCDILESDGHSVHTAEGGQAGIDEFLAARARAEPFAVVITDLGMPNVDGRGGFGGERRRPDDTCRTTHGLGSRSAGR